MARMHLVAVAACAALLATSGVAFAQQYHSDHHDNGHHQQSYRPPVQHRPTAARPSWYQRGGHVPSHYRSNTYIVNNWHSYHLAPPPRGYHWVRGNNGDFLLVAVATGLISNIVAGMLAPPPVGVVPVAAPAHYEYYCPAANAYYPYVPTCPMPWQTVAVPPPPPGAYGY